MNTSGRSELGCLQDAASSSQHGGEQSPRMDSRRACNAEKRQRNMKVGVEALGQASTATASIEVKKHQHKHNLKHRYEVMETLGKGTYGKVKKAVERVAIKSIRKERITDNLDRIHIQREIEITSSLSHPNIIRFHEVFESRDKIVIVMEYASRGELYDYIQERRRLPETEARSIFRQITSAVHYCHKNGVVHRDLKLENILLDQDLNVKLADFGLSNNFHKGTLLQTYCGSPLYAAPEIVKGLPYQGPEVDCWALGVLLYALVYSSMPFDGASHTKLTEQISQGRYRRPNPPSDACALIGWLLTVRVDERATIEDVANHWWVNWGYEESVCDCPSFPHQECPSPLLARYIDWQNQVAAASSLTADADCLVRGGISSLRKSRKENAIPQTAQGACSDPCRTHSLTHAYVDVLSTSLLSPTTFSQPSSKMPKKGILKNLYGGESGYDSNAGQSCSHKQQTCLPGVEDSPTMRTEAVRRRKGILKRNGKFSRSLDLPDNHQSSPSPTPAIFPEALQHLLQTAGDAEGRHSRPSSVVSEDSLFSSDSFDLLDLSSQSRRKIFSRGVRHSSEDDLEQLRGEADRVVGQRQTKKEML
uniref:non-specific serine/threonine protein kinase n=1 Tax=Maylandia zebra TaxID=106582 RepID=A0A3P9DPT3_9CICH